MNPSLLLVYEKLEHQRTRLLDQLNNLTEEEYHFSISGKWSIAQILAHLLTSETLSVGYMKKKSLGIETLKDSTLKHKILSVVLKLSQRGPFRYNAPKVVVANTPKEISLSIVNSEWSKSRIELKLFLETIPGKYSKRLIYKHPVAGMLDVEQALEFMYEHVNHHLPQIKRLLKQ